MSSFSEAMQKKSRAWNRARKAKPRSGRGFGPPDVPDGEYSAVITSSCEVIARGTYKGVPVVRIMGTINEGPHDGKEPSNAYFLEGKPPVAEGADGMPTGEQRLAGDLKILLPDLDVDGLDVTELETALDELNDSNIVARIGIRNRAKEDKKYQDMYFNELLSSGGGADTEKEEEEPEDEPAADDGEVEAPAVGDVVSYKPPKSRVALELEVKAVSQAKSTCTLNGDGQEYKNVAWDQVEILE